VLDHGSFPAPQRRALAGVAVGLAVGLCPLVGVVGGLAASMLTYVVAPFSGPVTLLVPASVGGLVGAVSGWAVSGWRRSGPWASAAIAVAIVVVPGLLVGQPNGRVGTVVWTVVLVPVLCTVGVLVRRGALLAGAATGLVGGFLAVDAGVTSFLAWLLRGRATARLPAAWLWFPYSVDGKRHPFPGTLDIGDAVGFMPHVLIAATAFAVCVVLVSQRVAVIGQMPTKPVTYAAPASP
jgi:hypothetical protein